MASKPFTEKRDKHITGIVAVLGLAALGVGLSPRDGVAGSCSGTISSPAQVIIKEDSDNLTSSYNKGHFRAEYNLSGGTFGDLDPLTNGATFEIVDKNGSPVCTGTVPAGAWDGTQGWDMVNNGRLWRWRHVQSPSYSGVTGVKIKRISASDPTRVRILVRAIRPSCTPVASTDLPIQVIVTPPGPPPLDCSETTFTAANCSSDADLGLDVSRNDCRM
jgi:hypothetical protein